MRQSRWPAHARPYVPHANQPRLTFCEFGVNPTTQHSPHASHSSIMLYLVGLGLADEKDITVKGLEIVKKAERVYLEAYTAVLLVEKDVLVS
jgi:hypothetical protein